MKIRNDFVSNSSSSSMIIADCKAFKEDVITKQLLFDTLLDLYNNGELKNGKYNNAKFKPFVIYDLKTERKKAHKDYDGLLEGWTASHTYKDYDTGDYVATDHNPCEKLERFRQILEDLDIVSWSSIDNIDDILKMTKYNRDSKEYEPIPDYVKKTLIDVYNRCGIITNKECLDIGDSRFFIHFEDNEMQNLNGMMDAGKNEEIWENDDSEYAKQRNEEIRNSTWTTESGSIERFYEILIRYWIQQGLIDPNDEEKLLSDFSDLTITFCGHEG